MVDYSFEKYMGEAIRVEHGRQHQSDEPNMHELIIEPTGQELGDLSLSEEVKVVVEALKQAHAEHKDLVGDENMRPAFGSGYPQAVHTGWDLGELNFFPKYRFRAINGDADSAGFAESIMLDGDNGLLYYVRSPILGTRSHAEWDKKIAFGVCDPEHTTEANKERIRYGLARLAARHELELPDSIEAITQAA